MRKTSPPTKWKIKPNTSVQKAVNASDQQCRHEENSHPSHHIACNTGQRELRGRKKKKSVRNVSRLEPACLLRAADR